MSIIKLTDPRYCSPLDSPNTHLSSSKGRVFVVPLLSGELSMANLSQKREREGEREGKSLQHQENRNWDTQVIPRWFPLIFHGNTRPVSPPPGVRITKLLPYQRNCSTGMPCKALCVSFSTLGLYVDPSDRSPHADNRSIRKYRSVPPFNVIGNGAETVSNYSNYLSHEFPRFSQTSE